MIAFECLQDIFRYRWKDNSINMSSLTRKLFMRVEGKNSFMTEYLLVQNVMWSQVFCLTIANAICSWWPRSLMSQHAQMLGQEDRKFEPSLQVKCKNKKKKSHPIIQPSRYNPLPKFSKINTTNPQLKGPHLSYTVCSKSLGIWSNHLCELISFNQRKIKFSQSWANMWPYNWEQRVYQSYSPTIYRNQETGMLSWW